MMCGCCIQETTLYLVFDEPICLGAMKFWNYSKTPSRGVRDFDVLIDDHVVYQGSLEASPESPQTWETMRGNHLKRDFSQTIVFSMDPNSLNKILPSSGYDFFHCLVELRSFSSCSLF